MHARIELNPHICQGKPVIKGTRVPVPTILGAMAAGDSVAMVPEVYPQLAREDIAAALAFAAALARFEDAPHE